MANTETKSAIKTILTLLIATIIASFCLTPGSQVEGQTLGRQGEGESIETRIGELSFTHDQPYSHDPALDF